MSIVVLGVNHRTTPLAILERVAIRPDDATKTLHDLCSRASVSEAVVLSTCNRTELYVVAERFHDAFEDLCQFFCDLSDLAVDDLQPYLYAEYDRAAAQHLFEVASGLSSDVLGEHEILGQVRTAWKHAQAEGATRSTLNTLFRHALETGKRARTDTNISRSTASVSYAAVEMATERLGDLNGRSVLVIGAGEMGEGMTVALSGAGVGEIAVMNRTAERALPLAERVGGRVAPWVDMAAAIAEADLVLTSTGAARPIIEHSLVVAALAARPARPLLMVDIAVPRDIDPSVASIPGVTLLDLDDLRVWAQRGREIRAAEAEAVRQIVLDEVERFEVDSVARQAAPLIADLTARADQIRRSELNRQARRLASFTSEQRDVVDALTSAIVAKLLHQPIVALRNDAGSPRGDRNAAVVRDLFGLE